MANFDRCERLSKKALAEDVPDLEQLAEMIVCLPESEKIELFKGRTATDIEDYLVRARQELRDYFPGGHVFVADVDNRSGKDLTELLSGTSVELKSGAMMTDASLGLRVVSWGLRDEHRELRTILSPKQRRAALLAKTGTSDPSVAVERHKSDTMDLLLNCISRLAPDGDPAPSELAHLFRAVALGHTSEKSIKYSFSSAAPQPLLLRADWDKGLVRYTKQFDPQEDLIVRTTRTNTRTQLRVTGTVSGRTACLYPNYKNSWKGLPASNWVCSPCFHVWIDE
jgi:hypothetical protein